MKLNALCQKLKRTKAKRLRYYNNKLFLSDQKKFFLKLRNHTTNQITNPPKKDELESFWTSTLSTESSHNTKAPWIQNETNHHAKIPTDTWTDISNEIFLKNIRKLQNWKAPGLDQVQNYWLKKIHALHSPLINAYNNICQHPTYTPQWLTMGRTTLIHKKGEQSDAKNYRPITCLPTTYKLLTLILNDKIYEHITKKNPTLHSILQPEQKGCRKISRGCKDQLLLDKCIMNANKNKQISYAWIDFQKAYDNVPHSWIKEILKIYKIDEVTTNFIVHSMTKWKTKIALHHANGTIETENINIRKGIFQGDSLSPLLFCMSLLPITNILNRTNIGVKISTRNRKIINHLLYMDDIKLYANGKENMNRLLNLLHTFTSDINMNFGIDKCAILHVNKGKIEEENDHLLPNLNHETGYRYLGLLESNEFHQKTIKEKTKNELYRRVRKILQSQINALNCSRAIKNFAVPVIRYSFGILHWTQTELSQIDRNIRKILYQHKFHHPMSDNNNIYLSRENGGRGIPCIEDTYAQELSNLATYVENFKDDLLKEVWYYESFNPTQKSILRYKQNSSKHTTKSKCDNNHKLLRNNKIIHGKFFQSQQNIPSVDLNKSCAWLKKSYLRFETESLICAAQEQTLLTNWKEHMWKPRTTNKICRLCQCHNETIMHIVSGCPALAKNAYISRHNKLGQYVHWAILKKLNGKISKKWYQHKPLHNTDIDDWTITWDLPILTDLPVPHNRPDIIIHNRKNHTGIIIDFAIPQDTNIVNKCAEKIRKYKPLENQLRKCWNLKFIQTVPIIIGALGTVTSITIELIDCITPQLNFNIMQKTVLIGTQNILRNFLSTHTNQTPL